MYTQIIVFIINLTISCTALLIFLNNYNVIDTTNHDL